MSAPDVPPTESIRALIRTLLEQSDVAGRSELLAQAEGIEYVDGPVTMMRLRVGRTYAPAKGVPSPLPNSPTVVDQDGEAIGMLLLWLDDAGYIDCLEYAWVTVTPPYTRCRVQQAGLACGAACAGMPSRNGR